ncbi:MAG: alpha/beta hydrolase [Hyphomicrobiales bacterium]|nr:alpha/beta hydrolase [Hyphomicrobiales bacterium]
MRNKRFSLLAAIWVVVLSVFMISGCTSSSTSNSDALEISSSGQTRNGEIYLFRGLANVFSKGMDVIGEKMVRRGLDAKVYNHTAWRSIAEDIVARSKIRRVRYPIIIMGHSLGGNATMQMSKYLGDKGVKVSYAVSFDPTITTFVGPNIGEVINYYLPNSDHTNIVKQTGGFTGSLRNVDVSSVAGVTHVTVEKNDRFQTNVINTTLQLAKAKRPKAGVVADIDEP